MREFSATQLAEYLAEHAPRLIDVREQWEYDTCHLENSELFPMQSIPAVMKHWDKTEEMVIICHHGIRSRQVCRFLDHYGFENVINLNGGIDQWALQVDRNMPTY
ncbi:MAG: rhodanese-like domain-containing protein [Sedimenticolaceae bacterium]